MIFTGSLRKLKTELNNLVHYSLPLVNKDGETQLVPLNDRIGHSIKLSFKGEINCIACGRKSKKSFAQGYCYPCFSSLPECDSCIMSPEKCHFTEGSCRDAEWGVKNCMIPHYVYLARSSSVKVGITRATQIPTRWIDQGAVEAMPIAKVSQRYYSGLLEVIFKQHISDRTSWQKMLKGEISEDKLESKRDELFELCQDSLNSIISEKGADNIELLSDENSTSIVYPVQEYPQKVKSINLEKQTEINAQLQGIKGQYLIFDTGVINIRKYSGYQIELEY